MRRSIAIFHVLARSFWAGLLIAGAASAPAAVPNRVPAPVDDSRRVYLKGNIHPEAQAQYDRGPVDPALQLTHLTLNFSLSPAQQADLDQLLSAQQNRTSPQYHQWLTPEQYGARFGVSDADLAKTTAWLQSQGLTVTGTARARNFVTFDGTAATVQRAFRTELHQYLVNGEAHFANTTEPSIPAALQPVVQGIRGLHNFRFKSRLKLQGATAHYNDGREGNALAPDDFTTIYDIKSLLAEGINGAGQTLVVVGDTDVNLPDLEKFRTTFNLPGQDPTLTLVPGSHDPGVTSDLMEADLDLEWSSAVARNATIIYVYAENVQDAWTYTIDNTLAPVMNSSYGSCEAYWGQAESDAFRATAQQGIAEGITWMDASGDAGAADCDGLPVANPSGLAVDLPASIPEVTGVGGSQFNEGSGTYWNSTNNANGQSVLSYIPETSWNSSALEGSPAASGGGASIYFSKPTWQTGVGVPSDGARDVPDVALAASPDHDGYLIYSSNQLQIVGGTSASAQVFGAIVLLLNQYLVQNGAQASPGLGNINPNLYTLAQGYPSAFHDITTGNNIVTVEGRGSTGTAVGFNAGVGYDQVTGLGSVDVFELLTVWNGQPGLVTPQMSFSATSTSLTTSGTTILTATVTSSNGTTPTGAINFVLGATSLGNVALSGSGGAATATLSVSASQLSTGANNIAAEYQSDNSTFTNAAATITINVTTGSSTMVISGIADGASFGHSYAPGEVLSIFGAGLATATQLAASAPLPTTLSGVTVTVSGVAAPLFLVSPGQLNVQIPYETPLNSTANLTVQSNGQSASFSFNVNAAAPAIFTNASGNPVPNTSANLGNTITMYITGVGALSPAEPDGAAPAAGTAVSMLPAPGQPLSVTVGGLNAPIQFAGVSPGLVGVMQVNYQIPTGLNQGLQPVVVTVGGASSAPARLTVLK